MHLFNGILGKKRATVFSTEIEALNYIQTHGATPKGYKHEYNAVTVYVVTKNARVK